MDEIIMEEERPGFFTRLKEKFSRKSEVFEEEMEAPAPRPIGQDQPMRPAYRYAVTIRRQVTNRDDAHSIVNGLKRGEQQVVNLSQADPVTRQRLEDFLQGARFALEAHCEEVGDNIYLLAPPNAFLEVAQPTPRVQPLRN